MAQRIVLVRHGQTPWNFEGRLQGQVDIPLNAAGRAQARQAGRQLAEEYDAGSWDAVVASPLGRAAETAAIIAAELGLEPGEPEPGLVERGYGEGEGVVVTGMPRPELDALLSTAEPEAEVVERGVRALTGLAAAHPGRGLVVVAHGTLIRLVVGHLQGAPQARLENGQVVELDPALLPELDAV
ncbi:histidine phosphatase family protein [Zafaria sp. J156]|uniref:histidine phosphatase family protein n=1 Tax=Zafaria sp. J156 TaxID=3116490 RepID=UPI002E777B45|nr:histidine phosphatase family protein [Zafaria sp. J156]MEE1621768.1 histidine phosphatase family protein [Zafaria sp. J156]